MHADYTSKSPDPYLDLDDAAGELGDQVQQVRAELESLKQKQEEIEKEKLRLEELKRRQDELDSGRSDMLDKLTRSLVVIQREIEETQLRVEQMHAIFNSFTQHLRHLESINARAWNSADLPRELSKALSSVEDARADYVKAQAKLAVDARSAEHSSAQSLEGEYAMYDDRSFSYWFKAGLAFTLPLQVSAIIGLIIWAWTLLK